MKLYESHQFENAPAGMHLARMFKIVDQGTQAVEYKGEIKHQRKVTFTFEVLGDDRMSDGRPFIVSRRFTASLDQRGALRPWLEGWRGRKFSHDDLKNGLELRAMLGQYGLLNLIENEKDGQVYTNIQNVMPLPKGTPKPEPVNDDVLFLLDEPDTWGAYYDLSDRMQEIIAASPEGHRMLTQGKQRDRVPGEDDEPGNPAADLDDDLPF
jgi:hypothetical protein